MTKISILTSAKNLNTVIKTLIKLDIESIKKIINGKKYDIKEFIKNQKLLLIEEEEKIYKHVPKILSKILDKIVDIKRENNTSYEKLYSYFFNLDSWTDEDEKKLIQVK